MKPKKLKRKKKIKKMLNMKRNNSEHVKHKTKRGKR